MSGDVPPVRPIAHHGSLKYSRRNGKIDDPYEVNFVIAPEYPPRNEWGGKRCDTENVSTG